MSDNHQVPVSVFEQGGPNPYRKFFTGETLLSMLVEPNDGVFNCPIGNVTFTPGARTNWHKHSGGQILLLLEGLGRYCERGGGMVHISIETNVPNNKAEWLEPVTDEEYQAF